MLALYQGDRCRGNDVLGLFEFAFSVKETHLWDQEYVEELQNRVVTCRFFQRWSNEHLSSVAFKPRVLNLNNT